MSVADQPMSLKEKATARAAVADSRATSRSMYPDWNPFPRMRPLRVAKPDDATVVAFSAGVIAGVAWMLLALYLAAQGA